MQRWVNHGANHWANHGTAQQPFRLRTSIVLRASIVAAGLAAAAVTAAPANAATEGAVVEIRDYNLRPSAPSVLSGQTVTFQNLGAAVHRIIADDGSFDSRDLSPGTGFNAVVTASGKLRIHCEIHPSMTATITVAQSSETSPSTAATSTPSTSSASTESTTAPLPTKLADTGVGDTAPVIFALSCLLFGSCSLSLHRRRQMILATTPSEAAWRSVTVGQRHLDDFIARRR